MVGTSQSSAEVVENVDSFRDRATAWVAANLEPLNGASPLMGHAVDDVDQVSRAKMIQRKLWDAGFAGLCYPVEYGGRGLSVEYQDAFKDATRGYELPMLFNIPTLTIILPTILDLGTEEQKMRFIPAALRGDELWVQFLSEPSGGSDLAGAITRADRHGDQFLLNGSKIWSTYAWKSDYALCVCRTNWDVPKHRGLSVLIVKVHQPGITITQIKHVDGTEEFCQEFFDDVPIPVEDVLGQVDDGWNAASRLLFHERGAVSGSSPHSMAPRSREHESGQISSMMRANVDNPWARQLIGEARVLTRVHAALVSRVGASIASGRLPAPGGSIARLSSGLLSARLASIAMEVGGAGAVAWKQGEPVGEFGVLYLARQGASLGGGTTEIARNIISERVLGMPRERAEDLDRPFREVRTNVAVKRTTS